MKINFRYELGDLDIIAGIFFLVGIVELQYNATVGLLLIGLAILKQFSGK
jgi:hypothetical protein